MVLLWNRDGEDMAVGTYELGPTNAFQGAVEVGVDGSIEATEGTLTIDAFSETSRKGSFNFKAGRYEVVGTFDITV